MLFPELLRKLRKQHALSQRELARKINVDFTYISKIETGNEPPPSEFTLIKMANVFGINKYDFILTSGKVPTDFHKLILDDNEVREFLKSKLRSE